MRSQLSAERGTDPPGPRAEAHPRGPAHQQVEAADSLHARGHPRTPAHTSQAPAVRICTCTYADLPSHNFRCDFPHVTSHVARLACAAARAHGVGTTTNLCRLALLRTHTHAEGNMCVVTACTELVTPHMYVRAHTQPRNSHIHTRLSHVGSRGLSPSHHTPRALPAPAAAGHPCRAAPTRKAAVVNPRTQSTRGKAGRPIPQEQLRATSSWFCRSSSASQLPGKGGDGSVLEVLS